jgi:Uma2 family endonuclease
MSAEPAFPIGILDGQSWPAQGRWTYEDYLRLPADGRRYEVIRGFLYVTAAPAYDHQYSVAQFSRLLGNFVMDRNLGVVLTAPFDVKLPDIADPVQPDVVFFRSGNQPRKGDKFFEGTPDLVVEVLSPTTRRLDQKVKLEAYRDAGIPEYWMVDPWKEIIILQGLSADRREYVEIGRGSRGERVRSSVLPGFEIAVADLIPQA